MSSLATAAKNWPPPPRGKCRDWPLPRPMPAAPTGRRSSWASGWPVSAIPASIPSSSPAAGPRPTNRPSRRPAIIGSCRASPTKPRSSAAPGVITAPRWPPCRPRASPPIGRCSNRACRAFCTSIAPIPIASSRRPTAPTTRARRAKWQPICWKKPSCAKGPTPWPHLSASRCKEPAA